jgi:cytidylate kinase
MYLNDVNVEKEIRTIKVSGVSKVAEIDEVRTKLVEQQQEMGKIKELLWIARDSFSLMPS